MNRTAALALACSLAFTAAVHAQAKTEAQIDMESVALAAKAKGCGKTIASHVYKPERLTVYSECITVTGTIVDATAPQKKHRKDGVRKEADGDTHGWLGCVPSLVEKGKWRNLLLTKANRR